MNSKEQLPPHTDAELSELPDALKQALRDAFPDPKGRIAAKVMEQIRAEREDAEHMRRAEKAGLRRRRHGLIMKYGGLAACMVILSGALVIASPLMDRTADKAAMDAAVGYAETVPETAAAAYTTSVFADTAAEPTEAEANVPMTAAAGKKQAVETEAVETEEETTEEAMMLFSARTAAPAEAEAAVTEEEDNAALGTREAFLQYLIGEGCLTEEEFTRWQSTLETPDDWTAESLCSAFQLDEALYDTWLQK